MHTPNTMMAQPNQMMGAQHTDVSQQPMMSQPQYNVMGYGGGNHQSMPQGPAYQNQMVGGYQQQPQYMNMQPHQQPTQMYPQAVQPQMGHQMDWEGMQPYGHSMAGQEFASQPMMPTGNHHPLNAAQYPMGGPGQPNDYHGYPGTMPQPGYVPEEHDDDFD